ncbi:gamma-glutamyl-gamma-aminobutyrate hydrolase family protein [Lactobacillus hominis]|uniref:Possible gamma-glutamyl-gamma-aminobutyrate hydrolase n=1 Tax=Lactobacillus hominis DSM 23910 = CRBIP 24.179 TaxID=1423758 RepID=I7IVU3_9LACO|nr:type 1 glutamine amidotransferase [Lactobacillus hominis]KRM84525.1 gamma-glutamyl-gamma-aminobutyrate hydrolase [Lactobacillus hominis DSM 23910 = CRBIP 24.179]MCT3348388.1 gamma-glutamyl-gamma-aminobutyrate hydrolase [Lactobacillus hominis]CCI82043.1 Possible gamma-glutamyl-gamma-aminobutyrate hydrolase [Lactobacillus hominis DSM 23910 = CRBIP 24.179]
MKKIAITAGISNNTLQVDRNIIDIVAKNGYLPLVLAPVSLKAMPEPKADFDALILTDGDDITPIFYNEEPLPELGVTDPHRDQYELNLIKASHEANVPILGIGRGMQMLNVAFGGSLFQDIYGQNSGAGIQHVQKTPLSQASHHVNVTAESILNKATGAHPYVNSSHHQAIKKVADNFNIVATAPDGIIEAIESSDQSMRGIQWRVDKLNDNNQDKIFEQFFNSIQ